MYFFRKLKIVLILLFRKQNFEKALRYLRKDYSEYTSIYQFHRNYYNAKQKQRSSRITSIPLEYVYFEIFYILLTLLDVDLEKKEFYLNHIKLFS